MTNISKYIFTMFDEIDVSFTDFMENVKSDLGIDLLTQMGTH